MDEYVKLISSDKKNYYIPKRIANLSEYMKKEIESKYKYNLVQHYFSKEIEDGKPLMIIFEEVTFEILEVIVEYLNTKVIIYLAYNDY